MLLKESMSQSSDSISRLFHDVWGSAERLEGQGLGSKGSSLVCRVTNMGFWLGSQFPSKELSMWVK